MELFCNNNEEFYKRKCLKELFCNNFGQDGNASQKAENKQQSSLAWSSADLKLHGFLLMAGFPIVGISAMVLIPMFSIHVLGCYSPFGKSHLPISEIRKFLNDKVTDTDTDL